MEQWLDEHTWVQEREMKLLKRINDGSLLTDILELRDELIYKIGSPLWIFLQNEWLFTLILIYTCWGMECRNHTKLEKSVSKLEKSVCLYSARPFSAVIANID